MVSAIGSNFLAIGISDIFSRFSLDASTMAFYLIGFNPGHQRLEFIDAWL